ncbi:MAG: hypothetical protein PUP91_01810 [Rhizonema sp. PD37]|nr:hypothetical protein [Rhizonema sp. PD37]
MVDSRGVSAALASLRAQGCSPPDGTAVRPLTMGLGVANIFEIGINSLIEQS